MARPPARAAASCAADGDVADVVLEGRAGVAMAPIHCPDGGATAAVIFPVPHTAVLRVVLPLLDSRREAGQDEGAPAPSFPPVLPTADQVASGWEAQTRRGLVLSLPDPRLASEVEVNRCLLLLADGGSGLAGWPDPRDEPPRWRDLRAVVGALDRWGFVPESTELLDAIGSDDVVATVTSDHEGEVLLALADHWRLTRDRELIERLVPVIAVAVRTVDRRRSSRGALDAASHPARGGRPAPGGALGGAPRRACGASGDADPEPGSDLADRARFLTDVRSMLVIEGGTDAEPGLVLCRVLPAEWRGQGARGPRRAHRLRAPVLRSALARRPARPAVGARIRRTSAIRRSRSSPPVSTRTWTTCDPRGEALLGPPPERAGEPDARTGSILLVSETEVGNVFSGPGTLRDVVLALGVPVDEVDQAETDGVLELLALEHAVVTEKPTLRSRARRGALRGRRRPDPGVLAGARLPRSPAGRAGLHRDRREMLADGGRVHPRGGARERPGPADGSGHRIGDGAGGHRRGRRHREPAQRARQPRGRPGPDRAGDPGRRARCCR